MGRHAAAGCSSRSAVARHRVTPITRIRRPGTRSDGAAREPARLCADGRRRATHGRQPKQGRASGKGAPGEPPCRMRRLQFPRAIGGQCAGLFRPGGWVPMRSIRERDSGFRHYRHRRWRWHAGLPAGRAGFSVVAFDAGRLLAAAGGFRLRRDRAESSIGPTNGCATAKIRLSSAQQQRQVGRRQHGAFCDGVAALSPGMVQGAH